MKKSTRFLLAAGATLAVLVSASSCGNRRAEKEAEAERARQEKLAEQKSIEKEREIAFQRAADSVYNHARDSVQTAMGYDKDAWSRLYDANIALSQTDIKQWNILQQNVDTLIAQNARQAVKEIESLLGRYKIYTNSDDKDLAQELVWEYSEYMSRRTWVKDAGDEMDASEKADALKPHLPWDMFGSTKADEKEYAYSSQKYFVNWDNYDYGKSRQQEIENAVLNIIDKMNRSLDKAILAETKKFAKYYPMLDLEKSGMPAEYRKYCNIDPLAYSEEHGWGFEYLFPGLNVVRGISVYDSKLDVDFFGVEGADYKLVKVATGKWQVVRTDKNGQVVKTPVFTHNTDYGYSVYTVPDSYDNDFSYEPGVNMGVHINVREVVWSKRGADDQYRDPTGKLEARRDSLAKEVARLEVLDKRMLQISHQADSVAKIKQQQYMARRFNKR